MSSDDCIAILATKIYPDSEALEYRVTWAMAIENCYLSDRHMKSYFKNSPVFEEYIQAVNYAHFLEYEYGKTEYGITIIRERDDKTWDEIYHEKRFQKKKQMKKGNNNER
jgi:hypothetical protein